MLKERTERFEQNDYVIAQNVVNKVIKGIGKIKKKHTPVQIIKSDEAGETAFVVIRCLIFDVCSEQLLRYKEAASEEEKIICELRCINDIFGNTDIDDIGLNFQLFFKFLELYNGDSDGTVYELKYKVICPEGYWGEKRDVFISDIKKKNK